MKSRKTVGRPKKQVEKKVYVNWKNKCIELETRMQNMQEEVNIIYDSNDRVIAFLKGNFGNLATNLLSIGENTGEVTQEDILYQVKLAARVLSHGTGVDFTIRD